LLFVLSGHGPQHGGYANQNRQINGGITLPGLGNIGFNLGGIGQPGGGFDLNNVFNSLGIANLRPGGNQGLFGQQNYPQNYPPQRPHGGYGNYGNGGRPQGNRPGSGMQPYPGTEYLKTLRKAELMAIYYLFL
jgi:hypothetical protein